MFLLEFAWEMLIWIGWWFPCWLGEKIVFYGSLGYARVDDEMLSGCIGIAAVFRLTIAGFVIFR